MVACGHMQDEEEEGNFQRLIGFTGVKMVFSSIQNSHPKIEIAHTTKISDFICVNGFHHVNIQHSFKNMYSCFYIFPAANLYPINFTGIMGQRSEKVNGEEDIASLKKNIRNIAGYEQAPVKQL
ncbi:hypothetical protein ACJX0J_008587, partial [Zea mays]